MKFLLDVPIAVSIAKSIWGNSSSSTDDDDSTLHTEQCLSDFPFYMSNICWNKLIIKCLGILMIISSIYKKTPTMKNIIYNKTTIGISSTSIYGEALVYGNSALYGLLQHFPFTAYGESILLTIQSIIIIILMWKYTDTIIYERIIISIMAVIYIVYITTILSKEYYYILMSSVLPILLYSRGSQVITTYEMKHTGTQSIITITISLVGNIIRIVTTLQEVGLDMPILRGHILGCILNFTMFIQYYYYQNNTKKFYTELLLKKNQKQEQQQSKLKKN